MLKNAGSSIYNVRTTYVHILHSIYELSSVLGGSVQMRLELMLRKNVPILISDFDGLRRQRNNGRNQRT